MPERTTEEKARLFDVLTVALTNCWHDGRWTWWNPTPACGTETPRATREEAVDDLVAWAERTAAKARRKPLEAAPAADAG